jgi:hypothetical protein
MSVEQLQRSDNRIGQSVFDGVVATGCGSIKIFEYEETMSVAQLQRDDVRIGQSDMHESPRTLFVCPRSTCVSARI